MACFRETQRRTMSLVAAIQGAANFVDVNALKFLYDFAAI